MVVKVQWLQKSTFAINNSGEDETITEMDA
jgi:hypothetical protein